jgi:acetate kinase
MKIFVVNCGSSSIKYQVYDMEMEEVIEKGMLSRIGKQDSLLKRYMQDKEYSELCSIPTHKEAFELIFRTLINPDDGILKDLSEIIAVGHRTAHGGAQFSQSTLITNETIKQLERCIPLAPLHNPLNLLGIKLSKQMLPNAQHVAVFDTCFHHTLPLRVRVFPIPYTYFEDYGIQRIGFHSQSYRYVIPRAAKLAGRSVEQVKMIVCHLGHGDTISAIDGGKSMDTSVGFSSFAGQMMGTRPGDFDPGLVFYLNRELGMGLDEIERMLYTESGLLGISGVSSDMRDVLCKASEGHKRCQLAVEMFTYRVRKFIGAYTAALGGNDLLVFTAGIGENSPVIRSMICQGLECLGIELDEKKNHQALGVEAVISADPSKTKILVVPTNEEQVIIEDTIKMIGNKEVTTQTV